MRLTDLDEPGGGAERCAAAGGAGRTRCSTDSTASGAVSAAAVPGASLWLPSGWYAYLTGAGGATGAAEERAGEMAKSEVAEVKDVATVEELAARADAAAAVAPGEVGGDAARLANDCSGGPSVLRLYSYTPHASRGVGCHAHADLGLLTLSPAPLTREMEPAGGLLVYNGERLQWEEAETGLEADEITVRFRVSIHDLWVTAPPCPNVCASRYHHYPELTRPRP